MAKEMKILIPKIEDAIKCHSIATGAQSIGTKSWENLDPTDIFDTAIYYKSKQIYMTHNCYLRYIKYRVAGSHGSLKYLKAILVLY